MKRILVALGIVLLVCSSSPKGYASIGKPMSFQYAGWKYEQKGSKLLGFIPSLEEHTQRPWELERWMGIFRFSDGKSSTLPNYDVFNIKKKLEDDNFDKENGFGLIHYSKPALGDLFDSVYTPRKGKITTRQWDYFREKFTDSADDPTLKSGHKYFYRLNNKEFLRTAGIVQRFGAKFERAEKVSDTDRKAHYTVSNWPELRVQHIGSKVKITYSASGYAHREIRVVAVPKGQWLGANEAKITAITTDIAGTYKPQEPIEMETNEITSMLGLEENEKVDFILDDGYGKTAIVTNPAEIVGNVDFVPTKLSLTDNGQLWMTFRFDGKDPVSRQSIMNGDGMPMLAKINITGPVSNDFTLPTLYRELPKTLQPKGEYRFMLGKMDMGKKVGTYSIKAKGIVNNPNHPKRALETPDTAYKNNQIDNQWTREVKAPETDLVAVSITANTNTIKTKQKTTVTAQVKNIGAKAQSNVDIEFFANGTKIHSVKKDVPANRTVSIGGFPYQPTQAGISTLSVHVDPHKRKEDKNRSNNVATTGCTVTGERNRAGHGGGTVGGCNQPQKTANWTVAYSLITGYPQKTGTSSWTDSDGDTHHETYTYTDYSDPIWKNRNVTYQEKLKIDTTINTKQGIKTDLENPKDSDRESRGSWEIRGHAKKNGLDPNHITRAGYGVELKVTTTYSSDWETKVPHGLENTAKPLGMKYKKTPQKVFANIYTKKGVHFKTVTLDKTSDNGKQATFEFPIKEYEDKIVGKTFKYRKYFTSPKWADGEYRIRIETDGVGATGIKQCQDVKYTIYGSMFDDIQNLRVFSKE